MTTLDNDNSPKKKNKHRTPSAIENQRIYDHQVATQRWIEASIASKAKVLAEHQAMKEAWPSKKAEIDQAFEEKRMAKEAETLINQPHKMTHDADDAVLSGNHLVPPSTDASIEEQALYVFRKNYTAWHNQEYKPGVSLNNEHFLLSDPEFQRDFYKRCVAKPAPSEWQALQKKFHNICLCESPMRDTYKRIALLKDMLVYDHYDAERHVTIISAEDWHITKVSPVIFLRTPDMAAQCLPAEQGNLDILNTFIPVKHSWEAMCIKAAILKCFIPTGPNPVIGLFGDQGSGKTFLLEAIMQLISPSKSSGLMSFPSSETTLIDMVRNTSCCAFDNVSALSDRQSDTLCKISTGIKDEQGNRISSLVFINGITNLFIRPDLIDRAIVVHTITIEDTRRRDLALLWKRFNTFKSEILAGIFNGLHAYFRYRNAVKLAASPRMMDFVIMVTAAEDGLLWEKYSFMDAYSKVIKYAIYDGIAENPIALAIYFHMKNRSLTGDEQYPAHDWVFYLKRQREFQSAIPENPKSLSDAIFRLQFSLEKIGILVERPPRTSDKRLIRIRYMHHKSAATIIRSEELEFLEDAGRDAETEMAEHYFNQQQAERDMTLLGNDGQL